MSVVTMSISTRLAAALNARPSFVETFTQMTARLDAKPCPNHTKHTTTEAKACETQRIFIASTIAGAVDVLQACRIIVHNASIQSLLQACQAVLGTIPLKGIPLASTQYRWMVEELVVNLKAMEDRIKLE